MQGNEITFWYIGSPLSEARMIDCKNETPYTDEELKNGIIIKLNDFDEGYPITTKIWNQKLKIKQGDFLHLEPFEKEILFKIPLHVHTLKQILKFINKKINGKIQTKYKHFAQKHIKSFLDQSDRRELRKKFQQNTLTWFDLLGDYCAWGGGLKRSANGIWTYIVNS